MDIFQRFLNRMSIKAFMIGGGSVLLLSLLALSLANVLSAWKTGNEVARLGLANELADVIIEASGYEAKERGLTFAALAAQGVAEASAVSAIVELRTKGDESAERAYALAREISLIDGTNPAIDDALKKAESLRAELIAGRKKADTSMMSGHEHDEQPRQELRAGRMVEYHDIVHRGQLRDTLRIP